MITANLSGNKISSSSSDAFMIYEKSRFGEKNEEKIEYSFLESIYLVKVQKMSIRLGKKILSLNELIKKAKRLDKRIEIKLPLYKALRDRGYVVKTALKFGADFRVYRKGVKPGEDHALWIAYAVTESESHSWHEFAAKNRVAHSTKKKLLIGIVDEEQDVTFYEVAWLKP